MRVVMLSILFGLVVSLEHLVAIPNIGAAEPPAPELFLAKGKVADFIPAAKEFLDNHPQHEKAWQTAWDLYQMSRIAGESKEARDARLRLVADYPQSLPARHLFASMSAVDYAKVLKACFRHLDVENQPAGANRFRRGFELGVQHFGLEFVDNELLVQLTLAAGKDLPELLPRLERWTEQLTPRLGPIDGSLAQVAKIAFDEKLTEQDKIIRLQNVNDNATAKGHQRLIFSRLPIEERESTVVATIVAEDLLEQEEFPQAARLLALICRKSRNPMLLYGWAHAEGAQGHGKEAAAILNRLIQERKDPGLNAIINSCVQAACKLVPVFERLDMNFAEQDKAIGDVVDVLKKAPPDLLEFRFDGRNAETNKFLAFCRVDLKTEAVEIVAEHQGKMVCAFHSSPNFSGYYLQNDPKIRKYAASGGIPFLEYAIESRPDGSGNFKFGLKMTKDSHGRLKHVLESLIASPLLSQSESRQRLAKFAMSGGYFPRGIKSENGERVLTWVVASPTKVDLETIEIHINKGNRITSIVNSDGSKLDVYYGPSGKTQLAFPEWPRVPVENLAEIKAEDYFRILGEGMELMRKLELDSEAEIAAKKEKVER